MFKKKPISLAGSGKLMSDKDDAGSGAPDAKGDDASVVVDETPAPDAPAVKAVLIVFGRDDSGKAHASRFGAEDREAAIKAAHLMGFQAVAVEQEVIRTIADSLPDGRVFDSGKAFVPFVKAGVCIALEAHAQQFPCDMRSLSTDQIAALQKDAAAPTGDEPSATEADQSAQEPDQSTAVAQSDADGDRKVDADAFEQADPPAGWFDVPVGTTVLAVDDPDDGWWEAEVTDAHKSGIGTNVITMLTLQWKDFPEEAPFVRRANDVAYLHPAYKLQAPSGGVA